MVEKTDRAGKGFRKLIIWQRAHQLVLLIYKLSESFPKSELFGLTSQMRRAAVSVASNIAEGAARNTKKEFIQFLHNAQGSLSELDTQTVICRELGYLTDDEHHRLHTEMERESKLISGLIKFLKKDNR